MTISEIRNRIGSRSSTRDDLLFLENKIQKLRQTVFDEERDRPEMLEPAERVVRFDKLVQQLRAEIRALERAEALSKEDRISNAGNLTTLRDNLENAVIHHARVREEFMNLADSSPKHAEYVKLVAMAEQVFFQITGLRN